jgi:hypothetical protein
MWLGPDFEKAKAASGRAKAGAFGPSRARQITKRGKEKGKLRSAFVKAGTTMGRSCVISNFRGFFAFTSKLFLLTHHRRIKLVTVAYFQNFFSYFGTILSRCLFAKFAYLEFLLQILLPWYNKL